MIRESDLYKNGRQTPFYKNCKQQRRRMAIICETCPIRDELIEFEQKQRSANTRQTEIKY